MPHIEERCIKRMQEQGGYSAHDVKYQTGKAFINHYSWLQVSDGLILVRPTKDLAPTSLDVYPVQTECLLMVEKAPHGMFIAANRKSQGVLGRRTSRAGPEWDRRGAIGIRRWHLQNDNKEELRALSSDKVMEEMNNVSFASPEREDESLQSAFVIGMSHAF